METEFNDDQSKLWKAYLFNEYEKYQKQNLRIKKLKRILDE